MPIIQNPSLRDQKAAFTCPLCSAPLAPEFPDECGQCDWVAQPATDEAARSGTLRDRAAVVLTLLPGLGHLYKGHQWMGVVCALGAVFAFLACAVAATFTAGFAILLLPLYWMGAMLHVYGIEDRGIAPPPPPVK